MLKRVKGTFPCAEAHCNNTATSQAVIQVQSAEFVLGVCEQHATAIAVQRSQHAEEEATAKARV
jgi:hypothetical protein